MTEPKVELTTAALNALVEGAATLAAEAVEQRLVARLDTLEQRLTGVSLGSQQLLRGIEEHVATLADRLAGLQTTTASAVAQLTHLHVELAEIKGRLGRLSPEITRSRTLETDRYTALAARVEALESALNPPR